MFEKEIKRKEFENKNKKFKLASNIGNKKKTS